MEKLSFKSDVPDFLLFPIDRLYCIKVLKIAMHQGAPRGLGIQFDQYINKAVNILYVFINSDF